MAIDETTVGLDDLETRLDRLRATYDQYFTGIERTPPAVQHKEVERKIQAFRKVQMRNTAHRFRFQTIIQKYTTYLQYWQRILRQIEEGTYKRDLARAARYGKAKTAAAPKSDGVYELDADALEDLEDSDHGSDSDVAEDEDFSDGASTEFMAPVVSRLPVAQSMVVASRGERPATSTVAVQGPKESALQVEVLPFGNSEIRPAPVIPASQPTPAAPSVTAASSAPTTPSAPSAPTTPPAAKPRGGLSIFGAPQKTTTTSPALSKPAQPTQSAQPAQPKQPVQPAQPASATARPRDPTPAAPTPAATPAATPARPVATPTAPVPAPSTAAKPMSADASLRSLYERYRDARKKNGEGDVDFDVMARQVRDTLPRLREKYPGAHVELDVTEKDGKTILRPVVRTKR